MNNVVDDAIIHIPQYEKAPSPDCPACIRGSIAVMQGAFVIRAHTHRYVKPDAKKAGTKTGIEIRNLKIGEPLVCSRSDDVFVDENGDYRFKENGTRTFDDAGNGEEIPAFANIAKKAPPPEFWLTLSPACFKAPPLYVVPMDHLRQATGEQLARLKVSRQNFNPEDPEQVRAGIRRYRDQLQAQVDELNRQLQVMAQDALPAEAPQSVGWGG